MFKIKIVYIMLFAFVALAASAFAAESNSPYYQNFDGKYVGTAVYSGCCPQMHKYTGCVGCPYKSWITERYEIISKQHRDDCCKRVYVKTWKFNDVPKLNPRPCQW